MFPCPGSRVTVGDTNGPRFPPLWSTNAFPVFRTSQGKLQTPYHEIHHILLRAAQAAAKHQGSAFPVVVAGQQVCGEPIESAMLTALFTSLNAALGAWLPLLGLLLGVGGPLCIYLQGRAAAQVAEITAGAQVAVAEITAAAQVEVARVAAAGGAQVPEVHSRESHIEGRRRKAGGRCPASS